MATVSRSNEYKEIESKEEPLLVMIEEPEAGKCCRICYENDRQETMIAPCLCTGDLKFIHRKCLNEYRAISVSNPAFTTCNTCTFNYIMEIEHNHRCLRSPKVIFRLRVALDIFKIAFCWFGTVSLFAFILLVSHTKDSVNSAYLWGSAIVFVMMGIMGIIHGCFILCKRHRTNNSHHHHDPNCCTGVYFMGPMHCDCGNCGGSNSDAGSVCLAILAIVAIILIIVGVIYSIIVSTVLISQMAARHYTKLNATLMTREYVVKNLEKCSKEKKLKMQEKQKMIESGNMPAPSAPYMDSKSIAIPQTNHTKVKQNTNTYVTLS